MSEQPIVWIGKKPKSMEAREKAVEPAELEALLTEAVTGCSFDYQDHVVAHGEFGSWLVNLNRDRCHHRVIWNGRDGSMLLEKQVGPAGWEELERVSCEATDTATLIEELKKLLNQAEA